MKTPQEGLEVETITAALAAHWGLEQVALRYVPLGFGSHHWIAEEAGGQKWFITIDDLRAHPLGESEEQFFAIRLTALQTAAALRDIANLSFVIGPIGDLTGKLARRLNEQFAMAVFPFLEVESTGFGEFRHLADRDEAMRLVGQVHNATSAVSVSAFRRDTLVIPNRADLLDALRSLDVPWSEGPYSEPARILLRDHADALRKKLHHFDELAVSTITGMPVRVVSHGEPHARNIVRTLSGELVVVDWDTVAYAPRERGLWMLVNEADPDWSPYLDVTDTPVLSDVAMEACRLHWNLPEISVFATWCLRPHERTEEIEIAWASLQEHVADWP